MKSRTWLLWVVWGAGTVALGAYLFEKLDSDDRIAFVPAQTSAGHYQIELVCEACHSQSYTSMDVMQVACEACHAEALDEARDSHPQSKFTDPRNADRAAKLDARYCVTCHVEHKPERTAAMGLTIPEDYCVLCHADIENERPSHAGMEFATCADAGCHNFHDNRALYEDFLLRHAAEPPVLADPKLELRNFASIAAYLDGYPAERYPVAALTVADADAGERSSANAAQLARATAEWAVSGHAAGGANCSACHMDSGDGAWVERPAYDSCATCHANEAAGFRRGRHGMRLDAEKLGRSLSPMRVADARLTMQREAEERSLDCGSCHQPHSADMAHAVVDACLECHADDHSLAYNESPHAQLWREELDGGLAPGSAVTCASCHLPRVQVSYEWGTYIHNLVEHNQSETLRPIEKMLRPVCLECHGYEFSVDALADEALIANNFNGAPTVAVRSTQMATERRAAVDAEREAARALQRQE